MKKKVFVFSIIFFLIDFLSKLILDKVLILGKSITVLDKFFYITKVYNFGVSFSLLENCRFLIIAISILIMIFLYFYMKKFTINKKNILAFSLVFGGLFGNLFDRLIYGYVIDFLDFFIVGYNYPVFNLADSFIVIGICLLIWAIILGEDNENNS